MRFGTRTKKHHAQRAPALKARRGRPETQGQQKMDFVRTLFDHDPSDAEPSLPPALRELYDGDLHFRTSPAERPYVFGNFVSTLDGIVSYETKDHASGSTISDSDPADRFIMGLLRASADAIIVGAHTVLEVSPQGLWIPEYTYPEAKQLYADYRINQLRKPRYPTLVIVSGSGRLDLDRAVFHTPGVRAVIITTIAGKDALAKAGATKLDSVEICAVDPVGEGTTRGSLAPQAILKLLYTQFAVRLLLHEGGPTLFGEFLAADVVDELFLTLSPQCAGRNATTARPGFVEGVEFEPDLAPRFQLVSVKQRTAFLYLRYRRKNPEHEA